MEMKRFRKKNIFAAFALSLFTMTSAHAYFGLYPHGIGAISEGMGGAVTAYPKDAFIGAVNPAGLTFVPHQIAANMDLINPDGQDHRLGYFASEGTGPLLVAPGRHYSRSAFLITIPSLAYSQPLRLFNQTFAFGFALWAGGLNGDYSPNITGSTISPTLERGVLGDKRFYGLFMEYFLPLTLAYKPNDCLSVGLSILPVIHVFDIEGLGNFAPLSVSPLRLTGQGPDYSYGVGVRAGVLYKPAHWVAIGAAFQPKIRLNRLNRYEGLIPNRGRFDAPAQGTIGVSFTPIPAVHVNADLVRIWYSTVPALSNKNNCVLGGPPCLGTDGGAGQGWNNVNIYKLGAEWQANEQWALRAGWAHSQRLFPRSEVLLNIISPLVLRDHYTLGVSDCISKALSLHGAFTYGPKVTLRGPNPLNPTQEIHDFLKFIELSLEITYNLSA